MLVGHAHWLAEVLERLVREEIGRLLGFGDGAAEGGEEQVDEKGFEGVLLDVDLENRGI